MPIFRSGKPHCHAQLSAAYSQASGSHQVIFDVAREDPTGQLDPGGTGAITIERAGLYVITFGVGRSSVASSSAISAQARIDAGLVISSTAAATTASTGLSGSRAMQLEEGQVLTLDATLHASITATFQQLPTFLCVDRVGPVKWTG